MPMEFQLRGLPNAHGIPKKFCKTIYAEKRFCGNCILQVSKIRAHPLDFPIYFHIYNEPYIFVMSFFFINIFTFPFFECCIQFEL